jgi:hypothetical protein
MNTPEIGRPDPALASTPEEFVTALNQLRAWAGQPSLRRLATVAATVDAAGRREVGALPISTLSDTLTGKRLPNMPRPSLVAAFVRACMLVRQQEPRVIAAEVAHWLEAQHGITAPDAEQPNDDQRGAAQRDAAPATASQATDTSASNGLDSTVELAAIVPAPAAASPGPALVPADASGAAAEPSAPRPDTARDRRPRTAMRRWGIASVAAVVVTAVAIVFSMSSGGQPRPAGQSVANGPLNVAGPYGGRSTATAPRTSSPSSHSSPVAKPTHHTSSEPYLPAVITQPTTSRPPVVKPRPRPRPSSKPTPCGAYNFQCMASCFEQAGQQYGTFAVPTNPYPPATLPPNTQTANCFG